MKVIFQQDVRGQGKKGEMKEVSEGYARNYLLPRKLAVEANKDNMNALALKEKAKKAQEQREREAADRLFALLPPDQSARLRALFEEFEARETPEAQFAHTVDNMQPTMLNDASDGKSWVEHGVHLSQVLGRNERSREGSEILWDYMLNNFILPHAERGELKPD